MRLHFDGREIRWDPGVSCLSDPGQPQVPQMPLQTALLCHEDDSRKQMSAFLLLYWLQNVLKRHNIFNGLKSLQRQTLIEKVYVALNILL